MAVLDELRARIAELEAENSSMADDVCSMTGAYERAEQAEAALAELRYRIDGMIADHDETRAALAKRDRMLERLAWDASIWGSSDPHSPIAASSLDVIAEYRARAEEGSDTWGNECRCDVQMEASP